MFLSSRLVCPRGWVIWAKEKNWFLTCTTVVSISPSATAASAVDAAASASASATTGIDSGGAPRLTSAFQHIGNTLHQLRSDSYTRSSSSSTSSYAGAGGGALGGVDASEDL